MDAIERLAKYYEDKAKAEKEENEVDPIQALTEKIDALYAVLVPNDGESDDETGEGKDGEGENNDNEGNDE